ncbi:MAG: HAMP domain-containing histidine kinase [Oscillospiraceae bacterium]|nr:HAMP domain-containing histidine kinase [Oscillospiraceae bacterium]
MEQSNNPFTLLNWVERPAFCVTDGHIAAVNKAAAQYQLSVGMPVSQLLGESEAAYQALSQGSLYLTLTVCGVPCNASVQHMDGFDLFLIEQSNEQLLVLSLAAQHLRIPLSAVMTASDRLFTQFEGEEYNIQADQINQGLYQIQRIISNMSDAATYQASVQPPMEMVNFTAFTEEFVQKASAITEDLGIAIKYSGPQNPVLGLANPEQIERAYYNLLSNAIKFTSADQTVEIKLVCSDSQLNFIIRNPGLTETAGNLFSAYRRTPGIEESCKGVGLGLTLVRSTATAHGGTLLVDHPDGTDTRVTMTIALTKETDATLRSPVLRIGDYAGGRDKGLLELSEVLKSKAYRNIN